MTALGSDVSFLPVLIECIVDEVGAEQEEVCEHAFEAALDLDGGEPLFESVQVVCFIV